MCQLSYIKLDDGLYSQLQYWLPEGGGVVGDLEHITYITLMGVHVLGDKWTHVCQQWHQYTRRPAMEDSLLNTHSLLYLQ